MYRIWVYIYIVFTCLVHIYFKYIMAKRKFIIKWHSMGNQATQIMDGWNLRVDLYEEFNC
jgi:hypothetical protein